LRPSDGGINLEFGFEAIFIAAIDDGIFSDRLIMEGLDGLVFQVLINPFWTEQLGEKVSYEIVLLGILYNPLGLLSSRQCSRLKKMRSWIDVRKIHPPYCQNWSGLQEINVIGFSHQIFQMDQFLICWLT